MMRKLFDEYINYLTSDKDLKEATIKGQKSVLNSFCEYAQMNGVKDIEQVNREFVRAYIAKLGNSSVSKRYQILSTLRSFGKFVEREGQKNALTFLELPKTLKKIGEVLTEQEVELMLSAAKEHKDWQGLSLIALLFASGIRRMALLGLRNQDVNIEAEKLRILHDKGDKEHYSIFGKKTAMDIRKYWQSRYGDKEPEPEDYLFPISKKQVGGILKKYAYLAGITKPVTCHTFRRTFATTLLNRGAGIMEIKELLHHENVSTTAQSYAKLSIEKLRNDYEKHPRSGTSERLEKEEKKLLKKLTEVRKKLGKPQEISPQITGEDKPKEEDDIHSKTIWQILEEAEEKRKQDPYYPYIPPSEAAEFMQVSRNTIYRWISVGYLTKVEHDLYLGKRISKKELEVYKKAMPMWYKKALKWSGLTKSQLLQKTKEILDRAGKKLYIGGGIKNLDDEISLPELAKLLNRSLSTAFRAKKILKQNGEAKYITNRPKLFLSKAAEAKQILQMQNKRLYPRERSVFKPTDAITLKELAKILKVNILDAFQIKQEILKEDKEEKYIVKAKN